MSLMHVVAKNQRRAGAPLLRVIAQLQNHEFDDRRNLLAAKGRWHG
jgi:hypothetical protein